MNPLVSCLCVTYNRPQLLKETLYFFLAQDYKNKELIIVNDQKNVTYKSSQPQVKIYNFNNRFPSLGEKRNHAKKLANKNAKYIFWIDDDDVYYPDFLSYMTAEHEKRPNIDVLKPEIVHYSTNNKLTNLTNRNVGFPTSSFTKEFSDKTDFKPLMFGSDQIYLQGAKINRLSDKKATAHVRWGLGIYHVSGGFSDIGSQELQKKVFIEVGKRGKRENKDIIEIIPEISDEVKKFYKKY